MRLDILTGKMGDVRKFEHEPLIFDNKCFTGIEIEVENIDYSIDTTKVPLWRIEGDGSLRNNGLEFISLPMRGKDISDSLLQLESYLSERPHDFSFRTSVHIHMDARDMEPEHLVNFLFLYIFVEPILFNWLATGRETNIYCVPLYEAYNELVKDIRTLLFGDVSTPGKFRQSIRRFTKYQALNLSSLFKYSTLEFRHMEGNIDSGRIMQWINIIQSIKSGAMKNSIYYYMDMYASLGINRLVDEMFNGFIPTPIKEEDLSLPLSTTSLLVHGITSTAPQHIYDRIIKGGKKKDREPKRPPRAEDIQDSVNSFTQWVDRGGAFRANIPGLEDRPTFTVGEALEHVHGVVRRVSVPSEVVIHDDLDEDNL